MKKVLSFIAIIVPVLCSGNVGATTCPAGCFCLNNGEFNLSTNYQNFCTVPASKINIISSGISVCHSWISNRDFHGPTATYYFEDFSELYKGYFGAYGFINGNFVYINDCWDNADNPNGIFQCPTTHPSSANGAKSLSECYKVNANGQKEYYTVQTNAQNNHSGNDISHINLLIQNLQSALNQANAAAQNLQTALNSYNLTNTTQNTTTTQPSSQTTTVTSTNATTTTNSTGTTNTTNTITPKIDATQSISLKKFDFGDLSSVFTSAKVAKPVPTRSATERQKSTSARTTATPTTTRIHDNAAAARPTQTKERASATRHQQR